jgi:UDP-galactopyranose mutase
VLERVGITIGNNDNYFPTDKWQGIPINGFTNMIEKMFKHKNIDVSYKPPKIKIKNNYVYINNRPTRELIFYCGSLDELFDYKYGHLPYRSLNIVFQDVKTTSFQNTAIVNYPNHPTMTRISEYKKLYLQNTKNISTISKEYPGQYDPTSNKFNKPFYPIQDETSKKQYHQYYDLVKDIPNFIPLGRLAQYKYYDMDDAIDNALALFNKFKDKTV